ncbi:aliphatic sulfonate ABC transporter substrate-binding protein [Lentibacillus amyloliquefaciens]|uniref:ABC transporter substrate-binding protein n=1 Tax=Lentibacillus amyloliquefaciens TaxID=1472767 RepID=A0A0U4EB94_9BACI|nr:aliphatic sulfonate ABC transporter substrate-binding protein [Lentibacillus amyloliquefaciens]ALX50257.1 ABC transporter substrate-binding protein [Lentibacillus amyloliquefaciens]
MRKFLGLLAISIILILAACGGGSSEASGNNDSESETVTIGYFPNLNHAPAMVAKQKEMYKDHLGENVNIEYQTFPDGATFMKALAAGEIEGGLVGPGPAMNSFISGVEAQIIGASSTGGTVIVSRDGSGIKSWEDVEGKTFISPRVGCTHNVQFETYMKERGITSERTGGSMKHVTGEPARYQSMFENGDVDVATAPEPWASVMEAEVDANVVIPTSEISFGKTLPAAVMVTSDDMVENNSEQVQKLVDAHKEAVQYINDNPDEAIDITIDGIAEITDQQLEKSVMENAWERTNFTYEVNADVIQEFGNSSHDLQFLKEKPDFEGFVNKTFIQ